MSGLEIRWNQAYDRHRQNLVELRSGRNWLEMMARVRRGYVSNLRTIRVRMMELRMDYGMWIMVRIDSIRIHHEGNNSNRYDSY